MPLSWFKNEYNPGSNLSCHNIRIYQDSIVGFHVNLVLVFFYIWSWYLNYHSTQFQISIALRNEDKSWKSGRTGNQDESCKPGRIMETKTDNLNKAVSWNPGRILETRTDSWIQDVSLKLGCSLESRTYLGNWVVSLIPGRILETRTDLGIQDGLVQYLASQFKHSVPCPVFSQKRNQWIKPGIKLKSSFNSSTTRHFTV